MDFRYLTESKNEFNNLLNSILVPHLYNGIHGMLEYSIQTHNMLEEKQKKNKNIQNPGIINIFKMCLKDISSINNYEIENEYKRIKEKSGCFEWFDNLIKASIKSYVLFLTWDPQISNSKYANNDLYDSISLKDFIHKCYIETCNYFAENSEIFLKKNAKNEIYEIIKNCIEMAIRKSLPYNDIIQEYLKINFTTGVENNSNNSKEIANIKTMVYRILSQNKYGGRPTGKALISEDSDEKYQNYNGGSEQGRQEMEKFIDAENQNGVIIDEIRNDVNNSTNDNQEIFKHYSATGSKNNSLKSKSLDESETSENFEVPEMGKSFRSSHHSHRDSSRNSSKSNKSMDFNQEPETVYQEISNQTSTDDGIQEGGKIETTTQIMTRSEAKRKELDNVINNTLSETSKTSKMSNFSKTSKYSKSNKSLSHLESPKAIRMNPTDRLVNAIVPPNNMIAGKPKRNVQIVKNKSNSVHDKITGYNKFFTNLNSN